LPKDVTESEVEKFFEQCGAVVQVALPRNKQTREPRGFAIVAFGTEAAVVNALKLDGDPFRETVGRVGGAVCSRA
jgi:RNA recognition motif-containing protein